MTSIQRAILIIMWSPKKLGSRKSDVVVVVDLMNNCDYDYCIIYIGGVN